MRRFDPAAALRGLLFMGIALFELARDGHGSVGDLNLIGPVALVVLGLSVVVGNRNRD